MYTIVHIGEVEVNNSPSLAFVAKNQGSAEQVRFRRSRASGRSPAHTPDETSQGQGSLGGHQPFPEPAALCEIWVSPKRSTEIFKTGGLRRHGFVCSLDRGRLMGVPYCSSIILVPYYYFEQGLARAAALADLLFVRGSWPACRQLSKPGF